MCLIPKITYGVRLIIINQSLLPTKQKARLGTHQTLCEHTWLIPGTHSSQLLPLASLCPPRVGSAPCGAQGDIPWHVLVPLPNPAAPPEPLAQQVQRSRLHNNLNQPKLPQEGVTADVLSQCPPLCPTHSPGRRGSAGTGCRKRPRSERSCWTG